MFIYNLYLCKQNMKQTEYNLIVIDNFIWGSKKDKNSLNSLVKIEYLK